MFRRNINTFPLSVRNSSQINSPSLAHTCRTPAAASGLNGFYFIFLREGAADRNYLREVKNK